MSPARRMPLKSASGRGDKVTTELRSEFFRAVDEVAPDLAGEMVEAIGPLYGELAERLTGGDLREFAWIARQQEDFCSEWREWAESYGLHRDAWILDHALRLLPAFLSSDPDSIGTIPRRFGDVPVLVAYLVPGRQITPPGPYRPDQESRAEYERRVSAYADLVEGVAQRIGWVPAPAKRTVRLHLGWLARFQVLGEAQAGIANSEHLKQRSVERAIQQMANLIGLTRRTIALP